MQQKTLPELLAQKELERKELVPDQGCLFCKTRLTDAPRIELFRHLWETHHFSVGHPDNLIFLDDFLAALHDRLHEQHACLFCEKKFGDFDKARLHMRKKKHFKIEGRREYDRYYLSNYVKRAEGDDDDEDEEDSDGDNAAPGGSTRDWESWVDDDMDAGVLCLLCPKRLHSSAVCIEHMHSHNFDLLARIREWKLDFFGRIKLINYIRRSVAEKRQGGFNVSQIKRSDFLDNVQHLMPWDEDDELLRHEFDFEFDDDEKEREETARRRLSI